MQSSKPSFKLAKSLQGSGKKMTRGTMVIAMACLLAGVFYGLAAIVQTPKYGAWQLAGVEAICFGVGYVGLRWYCIEWKSVSHDSRVLPLLERIVVPAVAILWPLGVVGSAINDSELKFSFNPLALLLGAVVLVLASDIGRLAEQSVSDMRNERVERGEVLRLGAAPRQRIDLLWIDVIVFMIYAGPILMKVVD